MLILSFAGIDPLHSVDIGRSTWVLPPPTADSLCPTRTMTAPSPSGTPFLSIFVKGCTYPLRINHHPTMPSHANVLLRLPRRLREDLDEGKSTD